MRCDALVLDDGFHTLGCKLDANLIARHNTLSASVIAPFEEAGLVCTPEVHLVHGKSSRVDYAIEVGTDALFCLEVKTTCVRAGSVVNKLAELDEKARQQHSEPGRTVGQPGFAKVESDGRLAYIHPVVGTCLGRLSEGTRQTLAKLVAYKGCVTLEEAMDRSALAVALFTARTFAAAGAGIVASDIVREFDLNLALLNPNTVAGPGLASNVGAAPLQVSDLPSMEESDSDVWVASDGEDRPDAGNGGTQECGADPYPDWLSTDEDL